jgi:hypothetical protein
MRPYVMRVFVAAAILGGFVGLSSVTRAASVTAPAAKELKLELKWTPKEAPDLPTLDLTGGINSFEFPAFADKREKPTHIGENPEKETTVVTSSDVPAFVHGVLRTELKGLGFEFKDSGADRVLKGELLHFWARDAGSYSATVRVKFTVLDGTTEVWTGIVQGTGENWGRSLKAINFTETFSGAISDLMVKLLQTPEFKAALKKNKS